MAMIAFANQRGTETSDVSSGNPLQLVDHLKPYIVATLRDCRTAAEWDTAATLMFPSVGGTSSADETRATFCDLVDPGQPACH
jgi:hypothetical protein